MTDERTELFLELLDDWEERRRCLYHEVSGDFDRSEAQLQKDKLEWLTRWKETK